MGAKFLRLQTQQTVVGAKFIRLQTQQTVVGATKYQVTKQRTVNEMYQAVAHGPFSSLYDEHTGVLAIHTGNDFCEFSAVLESNPTSSTRRRNTDAVSARSSPRPGQHEGPHRPGSMD